MAEAGEYRAFVDFRLLTEHPWAAQIAERSGGGDLGGLPPGPSNTASRPRCTTPTLCWPGRPSTQPSWASTRGGSRSEVTAPAGARGLGGVAGT
nr:hypothetical protein [Saccharopolyspora spinosa]